MGTEEWEKENRVQLASTSQSPCKAQFIRWSKCVTRARKYGLCEYVEYTDVPMSCTSHNDKYFAMKQKEIKKRTARIEQ